MSIGGVEMYLTKLIDGVGGGKMGEVEGCQGFSRRLSLSLYAKRKWYSQRQDISI